MKHEKKNNKTVNISYSTVYILNSGLIFCFIQGADFKNNQTTKQLDKFIHTNRKVETKLYLLPFGPNKVVKLFSCLIVFKIRSQSLARILQFFFSSKFVC